MFEYMTVRELYELVIDSLELEKDNLDYRGVVFIGLMICDGKPKVLEFNVRFGDPETQVILLRLESDLFEIMKAVSEGRLSEAEVKFTDKTAKEYISRTCGIYCLYFD